MDSHLQRFLFNWEEKHIRQSSMCKGPEVEKSSECSQSRKKVGVAGRDWLKLREETDSWRRKQAKVSCWAWHSSRTAPLEYAGKKGSWLHIEKGIVLEAVREAGWMVGRKPHTFHFFSVITEQTNLNWRISLVISCLFSWGDQSMKSFQIVLKLLVSCK